MKQVLSLESALEWAKTRPADEVYDWYNSQICACAQYAQTLGLEEHWSAYHRCLDTDNFWHQLNILALATPHNFGAFAERIVRDIKARLVA